MTSLCLILDTETHALNGLPIEVAYVTAYVDTTGLHIEQENIYDEYFSLDEDTQLQLASMAIHHILPQDLVGKPNFRQFRLPAQTAYLVGHNINYDLEAIARCGQDISTIKPICTLALARYLWPQLESHSLATLSYFISTDYVATREQLRNAHNAQVDILLTAQLLERIIQELNITSIEQLYSFAQQARLPRFMPFGKHKGVALGDVPIDYIEWLLRQNNLDPDLREALEQLF